MAVVITSKFYQESEWKNISKVVFTSPNIDSPAVAGTRSHILPGQSTLGLWYEDNSFMYRVLPDQAITPEEAGVQGTPMAKINLYPGESFSFVTDSSVLVTLESVVALDLGVGDTIYHDQDNYCNIDEITSLHHDETVVEEEEIIVYDDPFFDNDASMRKGTTYKLYWTSSGLYTDTFVDVYYSLNAGLDWISLVSGTQNDGEVSFSIPVATNEAKLKIISSSSPGVEDFSQTFVVNNVDVELLTPVSGTQFDSGNYFRVWWNTDHFYLDEPVSIHLSTNSGIDWQPLASSIPNKGYADVYIGLIDSDACKIKVLSEEDTNVPEDVSEMFSCDCSGQSIEILYPTDVGITELRGGNFPLYWRTTAMQYEVDNLVVSLATGGEDYITLMSGVQNTGHIDVLIPKETIASGIGCTVKLSKDDGAMYDISDPFQIDDVSIGMIHPIPGETILVSNKEDESNFWWNTNLRAGENIEIYSTTLGSVTSSTSFSGHGVAELPDNETHTYEIRHLDYEGELVTSIESSTITKEDFLITENVRDQISEGYQRSYSCIYNDSIYTVTNSGIHITATTDGTHTFYEIASVSIFDFMITVNQGEIYLYDKTQEYFYHYNPVTEVFAPKDRVRGLVNIKTFDDTAYIYGIDNYGRVFRYTLATETWSEFYDPDDSQYDKRLYDMKKRGFFKIPSTNNFFVVTVSGALLDISNNTLITKSSLIHFDDISVYTFYDMACYPTSSTEGVIYAISAAAEGYFDEPHYTNARFDKYYYTIVSGVVDTDGYESQEEAADDYVKNYILFGTYDLDEGTEEVESHKRVLRYEFIRDFNFDFIGGTNSVWIISDGYPKSKQSGNWAGDDFDASNSMLELSEVKTCCQPDEYRLLAKPANVLSIGFQAIPIGNTVYIIAGREALLPYYEILLTDVDKGLYARATKFIYNCTNFSGNYASMYFGNPGGTCMCYDGNNTLYISGGLDQRIFWKYNISTQAITELEDVPVPGEADEGSMVYNENTDKIYYTPSKDLYVSGVWQYDVSGDSWSFISDDNVVWPQKASLLSLGNYIYFLSNGNTRLFLRMNATSGNAIELLSQPSQSGYNQMVTDGIYVYACYKKAPYYTCRYDTATDTWEDWHIYDEMAEYHVFPTPTDGTADGEYYRAGMPTIKSDVWFEDNDIISCFYKDDYIYLIHGAIDPTENYWFKSTEVRYYLHPDNNLIYSDAEDVYTELVASGIEFIPVVTEWNGVSAASPVPYIYLSKISTVRNHTYLEAPTDLGWEAPPSAHPTVSDSGGYTHQDKTEPDNWVTPSGVLPQATPVYDDDFWPIRDEAPIASVEYARILQVVDKTGTETIYDTDSLFWWNVDATEESWVRYDNSVVFTITTGECYNCRLTAWDDASHSTVLNHLLSTDRARVYALAFNSHCAINTVGGSTFTPYEIIAPAVYNHILKGTVSYYGDFDMVYRYQSDVYGDYLMFKPNLYNVDATIPYGVHDFILTFHYSYT
jgi:hypothetical protein